MIAALSAPATCGINLCETPTAWRIAIVADPQTAEARDLERNVPAVSVQFSLNLTLASNTKPSGPNDLRVQ
jgi:hypothetical protein